MGDVCLSLPVVLALSKVTGPVQMLFADRNSICKRILERLHTLAPLLESQPYVESVKPHSGEAVHWAAGEFRSYHTMTQSLAKSHLLHYEGQKSLPKISVDFRAPWLFNIPADERAKGKIVVQRTDRYNNPSFPWHQIVERYGSRILFVGSDREHKMFCSRFGNCEYVHTKDLLEAASLVAGSDLFIGNQSCVAAIAAGLGHHRVIEICPWQPDVIVAPPDEKVRYVLNAGFAIQGIQIDGADQEVDPHFNVASVPPRPPGKDAPGWYYPECQNTPIFWSLLPEVMRKHGLGEDEARRKILNYNAKFNPQFFIGSAQEKDAEMFKKALKEAGA